MSDYVSGGPANADAKRRDQLSAVQSMLRGSFDPVVRGDDGMRDLLAKLEHMPVAPR